MSKHFKPERNDVPPAGRPPDVYRRFLTRIGGVNPYGEPRYRLVRAEEVLVFRGGIWHDWPEDTDVHDQGGLIFSEEKKLVKTVVPDALGGKHLLVSEVPAEVAISAAQPRRIVREMRWIPRYPQLTGWILQHWDPPSWYAPRETWENLLVPGGPPRLQWLGEFPIYGAYELSCEWYDQQRGLCRLPGLPELPPLGLLERSILQREASNEKAMAQMSDPEQLREWRRLTRMIEWQEQQEAEKQRRIELSQKMYRDVAKTVFGSSLAAGRLREQLAKRANERGAGITEHVGN